MSDTGNEPAVEAVAQLVPATLKALHALEFAGRHLSPDSLPRLIEAMAGRSELLVRLRQHRRRSGDRQRPRAASVAGLRCSFALEGGDADQDTP